MLSQAPTNLMCSQMQKGSAEMQNRARDLSPSTRSSDGCCSDRGSVDFSDVRGQDDRTSFSFGVKNTFFNVSWNEDDVIPMGHSATEPATFARMGSVADSPREQDDEQDDVTLEDLAMCTTLTDDHSPRAVATLEAKVTMTSFCNNDSTQIAAAQTVCSGMSSVLVPIIGHPMPPFIAMQHIYNQEFVPQQEVERTVVAAAQPFPESASRCVALPDHSAGGCPIQLAKIKLIDDAPQDQPTSIILRNLPLDMTREQLLKLLNKEGFAGKYDFVYLPRDFKTSANLGYAFVNLVEHSEGVRMQKRFAGFCRWPCRSAKKCATAWSSQQGLATYIERYRNNQIMHQSVPDEFKPALFQNRTQVLFPEPTRTLRAPTLGSW